MFEPVVVDRVTATEFAFLALGLLLGLASGAALIEVLRARPPVPRDVRLTIAEDAIPRRRAATLSDDAFITAVPQPARGGPADRRLTDDQPAIADIDRRTAVRSVASVGAAGSAAAGVTSMTLPGDAVAAGPFPGRILEPARPFAGPLDRDRDGAVSRSMAATVPAPHVPEAGPVPASGPPSQAHAVPQPRAMSMPAFGPASQAPALPALAEAPAPGSDVDTDPDPILTAVRLGIVVPEALDGRFGLKRAAGTLTRVAGSMPDGAAAAPVATHRPTTGRATSVALLERPIAMARSHAADAAPTAPASGPPADAARSDATADAGAGAASDASADTTGIGASSLADPSATDTCAAERRIAAERCGLAVRARAGATDAADAVRAAQRAYDEHMSKADIATEAADPRTVRREKEAAQARFRQTYDGSRTTDEAEAAARDWLVAINDINTVARSAATTAKRERAAAAAVGTTLERLGLEADAARIAAETAEAACLAARQALAECDERSVEGIAPPPDVPSEPVVPPWSDHPGPFEGEPEEDEPLAIALSGGGTPTIFRLVRGDRSALIALVERLSGGDTAARRRWQGSLTGLVDGIIAVSIEAGALVFPAGHHFWSMFTEVQDREIAQALSSLGHRFDGLGGFVDERVPSQRDLALALGYAGIDPMRIRPWPTETEMAALYKDVTVAADAHLAATAGDLSLAELVALLGRRADALADLWNEWGRVRPLLLEGA